MNIYFVCSIELGLNSGASLLVAQYAKNLAELGNDVTLFAPKYGYKGIIKGVNVIKIPCGPSLYSSKILYQILLSFVLAYKIILKRPDCFLVKHSIVNLGFVWPAQILKMPFVLTSRRWLTFSTEWFESICTLILSISWLLKPNRPRKI